MKVTLGAALALAASASAFPVRIITLSGPPSDENAIVRIHAPMNDEAPSRSIWGDKPCHEMARLASEQHGPSAPPQGPLGALLARLGLMPEDAHRHSANRFEITTAVREHDGEHRAIEGAEAWKHHVQEMIHGAEDKVLPIMQGGSIRILPIMNENGEFAPHVGQDGPEHHPGHGHHRHHDHDREQGWKSLEGKGGVKKHHHKHQSGRYHGYFFQQAKTFSCRLGRALKALHPTEAIAVAFVFGAGVGSILHVIFMIFLITIRLLRGGRTSTCAERRAARKARRAERKAIKAGGVRLEGEEGVATSEEVLPSYAEGETDRLVEKA